MNVVVDFNLVSYGRVKGIARKQVDHQDQHIGGSVEKAADTLIHKINSGQLDTPLYGSLPSQAIIIGCWFSPQKHSSWEYLLAKRWPISKDRELKLLCFTEPELVLSSKGEPVVRALDFVNRKARFGPKFNLGDWIAL